MPVFSITESRTTFPSCVGATTAELFIGDRYKFSSIQQHNGFWALPTAKAQSALGKEKD
ncbi:MAG: hypothetical protein V7K31_23085 [Nostoc sp.]